MAGHSWGTPAEMLDDRTLPFREEALGARMTAAEAGPDLTVRNIVGTTRLGTAYPARAVPLEAYRSIG